MIVSKQANALNLYGYMLIYQPEYLQKIVAKAMETWIAFCGQDLTHRKEFVFTTAGGFEYKDHTRPDYKENFHVSMEYESEVKLTLEDQTFLLGAKNLLVASIPIVREVAQMMGGENLAKLITGAHIKWMLRFLHYPPRQHEEGVLLALPHIDKSITVHFAEDKEGLEVFWRGKWQKANMMADHLLTYPGMLGQYYTECKYPALCHRVQALPETCEAGRNSIVLFADFGDVVYNKEIFGPTQNNFPAGENYNMDFETFKKYFTNTGSHA